MTDRELKTIDDLRQLSQDADELAESGKLVECIDLLKKGLKAAKDINPAYKLFFESELEHYGKKYENAIRLLENAVELAPEDDFLICNLGINYLLLDNEEKAIELLDSALVVNPSNQKALCQKGVSLSKLDREKEAIECFDKALEINSRDYHSLREKGVSLSKLGQMEEAIKWFDKALEVTSNDVSSFLEKGICLSKLGREEEAIRLYEQALEINENCDKLLRQKGIVLASLGQEDEAIKMLDQALEINPKDYQSLSQKGVCLSKLGNMEEAIKHFDAALSINPNDYNSLRQKGVSLYKLGQEEEALKYYNNALAINSKDYNALLQKAVCLSNWGRLEEAVGLYDQALAINPRDYNLLRERGLNLYKLGRVEDSIKLYDKALEINPKDYRSLFIKGLSLSSLGQEEEAIELYDKALEINPNNYDSMRQKGVSLSKLGQMEEAIKWFDKALDINSNDYKSLRDKGSCFAQLGQVEKSIKLYDKALEINPRDYDSLRQKGVGISYLGRYEDALEWLDKALEINPEDYDSLREKGVCLFKMGRHKEAIALHEKALEIKPNDENTIKNLEYIRIFLDKQKTNKKGTPGESKPTPGKEPSPQRKQDQEIAGLKALVARIRDSFKEDISKFKTKMDGAEDKLNEFILAEKTLDESESLFFVLRKWNSYTPILAGVNGEDSVGGGYFIFHKGMGVVVDPGYNFIDNFHKAGLRISDITHIVITHAHNDHTADFESLLTLFYKVRDNAKKHTCDELNIYLSVGAYTKLNSLVNLRDKCHNVNVINSGNVIELVKGFKMKILPAYHDDVIGKYYSIGLWFMVHSPEGEQRNIVLTSDTSLFPAKQVYDINDPKKTKKAVDTKGKEIWQLYGLDGQKVDVLVPHIGSVRKQEFDANIDTGFEDLFYPNHLGVMGTLRLITSLNPELAVISEFGEELKEFRPKLIKLLNQVVEEYPDTDDVNLIPGDLPFVYNIEDKTVYCVLNSNFVEASKIKAMEISLNDLKETFCYYHQGKDDGAIYSELTRETEKFLKDRREQNVVYFKKRKENNS